MESLMPKEK